MKLFAASLALTLAIAGAARAAPDAAALYLAHCASCHGGDRFGAIGPALLPGNLGRLGKAGAEATIRDGRPGTQMPSFKADLDDQSIKALAAYVNSPPPTAPVWGRAQIEASRVLTPDLPAARPVYSADPLNLFVVVEGGDHHVSIVDGDNFTPIYRFASRFALHGGPKFTPDGRYVYFSSRDGWVTKFDLWTLKVTAEIRAGLNSRNIALSKDGRHVAVANYLPDTLVILSAADLSIEKIFDVADRNAKASRVSAVYQAPPRNSFVVALKDAPEIWEISTAAQAEPFPLRRIALTTPLDDFFFDPAYRHVLGAHQGGDKAIVVDLDLGREVATLALPGMPHLGSGISWMRDGHLVMATPHLKDAKISVIDTTDWKIIAEIPTPGPGYFLRSHDNTPYAWADSSLSPQHRDEISIIDKQSLKVARSLKPAPGKMTAHVEFDRSGKHALVSVMEKDGALIVYDAATFQEIKRLPMSKPIGKYNVYNKITFSEGTSH